MNFKGFPVIYSKTLDNEDTTLYQNTVENMNTSYDLEPFSNDERVLMTFIDIEGLLQVCIRSVLADDGTVIETQSLVEHGENDNRAHFIVDLPVEECIKIFTTDV